MAACDDYSSESDCESYVVDSDEFTGYGPIGESGKPKPEKKKKTKKSERKEAEADEAKGEKEVENIEKCIHKIIKDEKFRDFFRSILEIHDVKPPRTQTPAPAEDDDKDESEDMRCKFSSIRIIDYFNNKAGKIDLSKSRIHIVVYGDVNGQTALKYRTLYRLLSQTYNTSCNPKLTQPNKILHAIAKIVLDHNIDFSIFIELHDGDLVSFYNCPAETEDLLQMPPDEE